MKQLRFKQVDVFTRVPFKGNPVAVVLEGAGLSDAEMQRIAAWTNLSETTFVLPPTSAGADYRLRIFTPRAELPFAGHPTLGSAHAVLEAGIAKATAGKLKQECGAGVLELTVEGAMLWLKAPKATAVPVGKPDIAKLEKALGAAIIGKPMVVSVGPIWLVAELAKRADVARLKPDMAAIASFTDHLECTGITVFGASEAGRAGERKAAMEVRSFAPAHGIPEDPVCGSGNVSVAHYLLKTDGLARYGERYESRQGMQVGRAGRVAIRVEEGQIYLGGRSVTCVEGTLRTAQKA
jgi:PhzF family phenazine biosynthesis protein